LSLGELFLHFEGLWCFRGGLNLLYFLSVLLLSQSGGVVGFIPLKKRYKLGFVADNETSK